MKEIIRVGQIGIRFLMEAADTNGSVAMFEFTVPVGANVPVPHYHKAYDETIYGVEGVDVYRGGNTGGHWPGGNVLHSARSGSWLQQPEADRCEGAGHHHSGAARPGFLQGGRRRRE